MTLYKASWHGVEGQASRKHCYVIADSLAEATIMATEWGGSEPHESLRLTAPLLDARKAPNTPTAEGVKRGR